MGDKVREAAQAVVDCWWSGLPGLDARLNTLNEALVSPQQGLPDVDELAQEIRRIDGSHSMGAGVLAEKLIEWFQSRSGSPPQEQAPNLIDERIDHIADLVVKGMPEGISGFCKSWGWRQFARAILKDCAGHVPQEQAPGWMPIETAPKKSGNGLVDIFTDRRYAGCHWDAICGEYRHIDHSGTLFRLSNAKFWMPAPAAPSQEQASLEQSNG